MLRLVRWGVLMPALTQLVRRVVNRRPDHYISGLCSLTSPTKKPPLSSNGLTAIVKNDRFPFSERIRVLKAILPKMRPGPVREPSLPRPKRYEPPRATASQEMAKVAIDGNLAMMSAWKDADRHAEYIARMKKLRQRAESKSFDAHLLADIFLVTNIEHLPPPQTLPPGVDPPRPISVTFIPASVFDNPALSRVNPEYLAWLLSLPLLESERLLGGKTA
jgi:hypothetical protein